MLGKVGNFIWTKKIFSFTGVTVLILEADIVFKALRKIRVEQVLVGSTITRSCGTPSLLIAEVSSTVWSSGNAG